MSLDNILRLSYWTDSAITNEPAGAGMWLVALFGLAFAVVPLVPRLRGRWMWPHVAAGALIAAVAIGRLFAIPVLGWRLGWLLASLLSGGAVVVGAARAAWRDGALADAVAAGGFGEPGRGVAWRWDVAGLWVAVHALGMAACFVTLRLPAALGIGLVGLAAAVGIVARRGRRGLAALAPFIAAEMMLALRLAAALVTRTTNEAALPQPLESALNVPLATWVACGLALAAAWRMLAGRLSLPFAKASALALMAGCLAWGAWLGATLATRGVTGSDPYAYAQMGVDLARRGTVTHAFPLVRITYELGIPSEPVTHIGYREPQDIRREAPTVWPPGYAVFTGVAYALLGESGLYAITPALAALALILVGLLAFRVAGGGARGWAVAGLAVALTATSYQQVEWQLIPMADIASQALSIGALLVALLTPARGRRWLAVAAGILIGLAFDVRYTQVLIAPAIALGLWLAPGVPRRERAIRIGLAAFGALAAALPLLAYHSWAFGGPFTTGSEELQHFSLAGMPPTLARILSDLGWYREFGLIAPLMAYGAWALARARGRLAAVLAAFALPVFVFHLAYAYLRQRDLLSIFPIGAILAAFGTVRLIEGLLSYRRATPAMTIRRGLAVFGAIFALTFGMGYRSIETFQLPLTRGFSAFGYLVGAQRASFDTLKALTPPEAVIACSLNSGAIDLYTGRLTFRPATWTPGQLLRFVDALRSEGRPAYVVDESNELQASLAALRGRYTLTQVGAIDVPYYFMPGGGSENRRVPVYRVE